MNTINTHVSKLKNIANTFISDTISVLIGVSLSEPHTGR